MTVAAQLISVKWPWLHSGCSYPRQRGVLSLIGNSTVKDERVRKYPLGYTTCHK
jgi:hypothetical protein